MPNAIPRLSVTLVLVLSSCWTPRLANSFAGNTVKKRIVVEADGSQTAQLSSHRVGSRVQVAVDSEGHTRREDDTSEPLETANVLLEDGSEELDNTQAGVEEAVLRIDSGIHAHESSESLSHHESMTVGIMMRRLSSRIGFWGAVAVVWIGAISFILITTMLVMTMASSRSNTESIAQQAAPTAQAGDETPVEEGPLMKAFVEALWSMDSSTAAFSFLDKHRTSVAKALNLFSADGRLLGQPLPASCYNDLYKWTMFPVIAAVEKVYDSDVRCTFSVNIRDEEYRKQLYQSATGEASPELFSAMKCALADLALRPFDRALFERCTKDYSIPGWDIAALDSVCGTVSEPRMLIQEFRADGDKPPAQSRYASNRKKPPAQMNTPSTPGNVLVEIYVAHDEKLQEKRVYIEATGPWHRVTWLETVMMQCVYDVLLRDRKRKEFQEPNDSIWYPKWLAEAFCRCTRSVQAAVDSQMAGALFTGRRTGGLPLVMIQGLYAQHAFKSADGRGMMLGSSSVTGCYMTLSAGVPAELVPKASGTHAHELSMVIGAILGEVDDKAGMPLSQIIGHMMYFYLSRPQGDVRDAARKPLMPMLPDTLGSRAFMQMAAKLTVPHGLHQGNSILSIIGAARQDSGGLDNFRKLMEEFNFKGMLMASEIETPQDLMTARDNGYQLFGAGGFMGDSEKAWDSSKHNISMACKVLRVCVQGKPVPPHHTPVKTGDAGDGGKIKEGKFEADGTLSPDQLSLIKRRSQKMATATPLGDDSFLQKLFEQTLARFVECDVVVI